MPEHLKRPPHVPGEDAAAVRDAVVAAAGERFGATLRA